MTIKKLSGYFDYAAASPLSSSAKKSMEPFLNEDFYNPSSIYLKGREVRLAKEAFKAQIARALGSRPSEIVFTAGGTEANNLAIKGIMNSFDRRVNLVTTAIEHDSILRPAENYNYKLATVDGRGLINVEQLSKLIDNQTILISVGYVNNEIGSIQPIKQLAELVTSIRQKRQKEKNPLPLSLHLLPLCQPFSFSIFAPLFIFHFSRGYYCFKFPSSSSFPHSHPILLPFSSSFPLHFLSLPIHHLHYHSILLPLQTTYRLESNTSVLMAAVTKSGNGYCSMR
jgi:hypothetical protein